MSTPPYSSWMRYLSPNAGHRRPGLICLGVGVQEGELPLVGPRFEYLLGIRLSRAKELLARTDVPVAGMARRVGYEDPAYFSRLFSRRVGMAPVRFRAQQSGRPPLP